MGWRFWKTINILPGVRLNISKRGISVSVGRRGISVTFGKHGIRFTVGIPGTGISYTDNIAPPFLNQRDKEEK